MKIAILIASERKNGNSELLGRYINQLINAQSSESELIFLKDYAIKQCQGCMSCVFKNVKCKLDDDLYKLADKIVNADGIILIAPTYVLTIPGKLKVFLDRFLCLYPLIKDKPERPAISIGIASPIDWNQFQLPLMNITLLALGCRIVDSFFMFGAGQGEVLLDKKAKNLEKSIEKMIYFVNSPYSSVISKYCPVDYCNSFQRIENDLFRCPVCLTSAKQVEKGFYFDEKDLNSHRWTKQKMEEHFKDWILATKDRFRRLLPEIYREKKKLGIT